MMSQRSWSRLASSAIALSRHFSCPRISPFVYVGRSCMFTYVCPVRIAATRSSNVITPPSAFFAVASGAVKDAPPSVDLSAACVRPLVNVTTIGPGLPGVVSRWMWNPESVPASGVELAVHDMVGTPPSAGPTVLKVN